MHVFAQTLCIMPFVCSFFYLQVLYFANMGDFQTSIRLSDNARYWTRITVVLGIASYLLIIITVIVLELIV